MAGHGGGGGGHGGSLRGGEGEKKKPSWGVVLRESAELLRQHRSRMFVGLLLVLVNRAVAMVPPAATGFLLNTIVGDGAKGAERHPELLWPLAGAVLLATMIQAVAGYALSQLMGVAAQRMIHEARGKRFRTVCSANWRMTSPDP